MERRKSVWTLAGFQRWFVIWFACSIAGFLSLLSAAVFLWFRIFAGQFIRTASAISPTFQAVMEDSLRSGFFVLGLICLGLVGFATYLAMHFSARIAGPVFGVIRHLDKVAESGEWTPLALRKGDHFIEIQNRLNATIPKLISTKPSKRVRKVG